MISPSTSGGEHLEKVQSSHHRSLCFAKKKHQLSTVFFPDGCDGSSGCGYAGPSMAKYAALYISPYQPDLSHPSQGERTGLVTHSDSPAVGLLQCIALWAGHLRGGI